LLGFLANFHIRTIFNNILASPSSGEVELVPESMVAPGFAPCVTDTVGEMEGIIKGEGFVALATCDQALAEHFP
jgi:hypothetical protein